MKPKLTNLASDLDCLNSNSDLYLSEDDSLIGGPSNVMVGVAESHKASANDLQDHKILKYSRSTGNAVKLLNGFDELENKHAKFLSHERVVNKFPEELCLWLQICYQLEVMDYLKKKRDAELQMNEVRSVVGLVLGICCLNNNNNIFNDL